MSDLRLSVHLDGEYIGQQLFEFGPIADDENIVLEVNLESEEVEVEEQSPQYGLDTDFHEWDTLNGDTVWVAMRNVPYPEYCEECGEKIHLSKHSPVEARGEVWDRRICKEDPIYRPQYIFCCEECRHRFLTSTMRIRYNDAPPIMEVQIVHKAYDRFAEILINGVSVYTTQIDNGSIFTHSPEELPMLHLHLPITAYTLISKVMGPGNIA